MCFVRKTFSSGGCCFGLFAETACSLLSHILRSLCARDITCHAPSLRSNNLHALSVSTIQTASNPDPQPKSSTQPPPPINSAAVLLGRW